MAPILEGCKVVDFTQYLAGAGVTRMMAELGADIVKIERAPVGDPDLAIPEDARETLEALGYLEKAHMPSAP